MADDTIRVTTESTEKVDQNDDTESESPRVQDRDRTITRSEASPRSEEENEEVNAAIEKLKADQDTLKKNLSESKLESGESIGSSSAAEDTLSEEIGFDQKMSKAKLSGEQFDVGGSSTTQEDPCNDDEFHATISNLSRCVRDVDRTITRIEATLTTEEEARELNAALELLKADHEILKTKLSDLKLRSGESAASSAEQEDQNNAIEDEIRANILNLSRCVQDIDRAMARTQATQRTEEETEKLNAAFQLLKDGQDIVKNNLTKRKLEVSKSADGSSSVADDTVGLDDIRDDQSIAKKKLSGLQSVVVGSSSLTADKPITASVSTQQDDVDEEKKEELKALIERLDAAEYAAKTNLNELQLELSKFIGSSSEADNAIIADSKPIEEDQEIRLDKLKKRYGDSLSDVGECTNNPKKSKEVQKSSEFEGDFSSDSGESTNEEQRMATAVQRRAMAENTEGRVVSQKLMDSIERGGAFVHTSSTAAEELKDVPIEGSEPEISCPTFDLVDQAMQAMQQVEDVLREVEDVRQNLLEDLEAENRRSRLNEIRPVITATIASLAALCAVFCGRAKEGKGQGGNKD